jgi:hypothetical protein
VAHYFLISSRLTAEAAVPERLGAEKARGQGAIAAFAARTGLGEEKVVELLTALPRPTHEDLKQTFFRLYSDRVLATLGVVGGAARLLFGGVGGAVGGAMALSSALYLHRSVKRGVDRYSSLPVKRLYAGAQLVRRVTGAPRCRSCPAHKFCDPKSATNLCCEGVGCAECCNDSQCDDVNNDPCTVGFVSSRQVQRRPAVRQGPGVLPERRWHHRDVRHLLQRQRLR